MNVETPAPLSLSLFEAENQRTTKRPRMPCLKVTRCVEAIKKIRECELHCLEAMVGLPFTLGPKGHTHIENPLTSCSFLRDLDGNETRPSKKPFPL